MLAICDEINSSFANVTDIEPIIKDDNTITFIDQKPIQGIGKRLKDFPGVLSHPTANIQVYGFDKGKSEGAFLKNISFNTKISNKISSQLSIGATAAGVAAGEDATGFSKWNAGLAGGVIIANPVPEEFSMDATYLNGIIGHALAEATRENIKGKAITPYLLSKIKELTAGKSLVSNIELVLNNARLAAEIAVASSRLKSELLT